MKKFALIALCVLPVYAQAGVGFRRAPAVQVNVGRGVQVNVGRSFRQVRVVDNHFVPARAVVRFRSFDTVYGVAGFSGVASSVSSVTYSDVTPQVSRNTVTGVLRAETTGQCDSPSVSRAPLVTYRTLVPVERTVVQRGVVFDPVVAYRNTYNHPVARAVFRTAFFPVRVVRGVFFHHRYRR